MDTERILAFRLARSGLSGPRRGSLSEAAACPASDFNRDAAMLALAARAEPFSREDYDAAVDSGELVVAHVMRGAIHAVAPGDFALYGRALLARQTDELGVQLGSQMQRLAESEGFDLAEALDEVAEATRDALAGGRALDRNELHEEYRSRVRAELMPWCRGCKSHHVAPMLWRFATVKAGVRLDAQRRYRLGKPGRAVPAAEAARRYLRFYGPARPGEFAEWAGLAKGHAARLWDEIADELAPAEGPAGQAWILAADADELASPPEPSGVYLLPPGDPVLRPPNRPLLVGDEALRKRLFRPVASPGAVLANGRVAGLWKARAKGRKLEIAVERTARLAKSALEEPAERIAALRGAELTLVVS